MVAADHGVLATVHSRRGVDAVPVVFAVYGSTVVVPVDRVKDKRSARLQRVANLAADPRCVLLVDHYDEDWSTLWWVRVHARAVLDVAPAVAALAARFPAYREPGAVAATISLHPTEVLGWTA